MLKLIRLTPLFLFFLTISAHAQQKGNIEIFSKNGESFYVILNGQQMHEDPETNVKLRDLDPERYKLKVIFEDSDMGSLDKNIIVKAGYEFSYIIRKNLFDNYAIKPYSKGKISSGASADDNGSDQSDDQGSEDQGNSSSGNDDPGDAQGQQEGQGHGKGHHEGVSISVDINSSDSSFNTSVTTKTHHSHSETKSSSVEMEGSTHQGQQMEDEESKGSEEAEEEAEEEGPLPDYSGPTGCQGVISDNRFGDAKNSIKKKSFADSKMTQAKRMTKNNCLLTDQVIEIIKLFNFEDDRLEYAKFAYDHTYDQGNYYKVHDSFEFSSTIDELDQYLESK